MLRRAILERSFTLSCFVAFFALSSVPTTSAAPNVLFSSVGSSGCVTQYGSTNNINAMRFRATSTFTANIARWPIGNQTSGNFSSSRLYVMSSNPSGGTPLNTLAIFTPDTITGTGAFTTANYTGNVTINSGTIFWLVFGQRSNVISYCYISPTTISALTMNSVVVDTSTTLTNTTWTRGQSTIDTQPVGGTFNLYNSSLVYQISLEYSSVTPVTVGLSLQNGTQSAVYRSTTDVVATVDAISKVTFYSNDKVIPGCRNIQSNMGTATCSWKPSTKGSSRLFAQAVPTDSNYIAGNSKSINIGVGARKNLR